MKNRIVYTRPDGGISIVIPAYGVDIETVLAKDVPVKWVTVGTQVIRVMPGDPDPVGGVLLHVPVVRIVDENDIPSDRTFRDAWEDTGKIKPNMVKAQKIHMDRIRAVRNAELAKLDISQMTAISKGDAINAGNIEETKQTLRDIPTTFDLTKAKTADELKLLWPSELPRI